MTERHEHRAARTSWLSRTARGSGRRPWAGALGVVLVLVLAAYLFAANARLASTHDSRQPQDLAGLVLIESERLREIEAEVQTLQGEVIRLTDAQTGGMATLDPEAAALEALAAGRVAVTGPGLTVRLTDAPTNLPQRDGINANDLVVHQQDLQAVINALWVGGAEAMTLQGQRVISTSAFRCVGNVLILHGQHYSPPYVVQAIGDPDALLDALLGDRAIQSYLTYVEEVGLGWDTSRETELELPAYEGPGVLTHASVPEGVEVLPAPQES